MDFVKKALTLQEQIDLLKSRSLIIKDETLARNFLSNVSYYRLRAYMQSFYFNINDPEHHFKENTFFEDLVNLYVFDRKLRLLVFDAIEKIEVSFRAEIIYHFTLEFKDNWWFENESLFSKQVDFDSCIKNFDEELKRSSDVFIRHFREKYNKNKRPPSWMMLEIVPLGTLSKLFRNIKMCQAKKEISKHYLLPSPYILESWMQAIAFVRNICAHHGRLWNKKLTITPTIPNEFLKKGIIKHLNFDNAKFFSMLSIIIYLIKIISPTDKQKNKFIDLTSKYPVAKLSNMGFPADWESFDLWKI
jgi:abortive infection bacteriophage resistance protein